MRPNRILVLVSGIVLLALVALYVHHRHATQPAPQPEASVVDVSVVPAHIGAITQDLTVAGIFQPFQEIDVHGEVSGYIRHIYVDIGDRVRKGQTLAILDVPELAAQVKGAQASVKQAQDEIARLRTNVVSSQANYAAVHANYVRLKEASDQQPGLVAAQELEDALARDQAAEAAVAAAKAAVAAGQGNLGVSQANQSRFQSLVNYSDIQAPFDGVVTMRYADTGALIPAGTSETQGQAVVRLAQSDLLRLRMPVPETDVPLVHIGSQVTVSVQATGQQFQGSVVRFTRDVSNATRTMLVEVDVPNPSLTLTPGMYANVTFHLQQQNNALLIPTAAVIQGDQPAVFVVDSNSVIHRQPIVLSISSANEQAVTGGLTPGEDVIVGGLETLQPGQHVHPQPAPANLFTYHAAQSTAAEGAR
jgi:RND family efflux transporter MFP subunit